MSKISGHTDKMKWENSTVQLINWLVKAAGARYALCVDHGSVTVKKKKQANEGFIALFFSPWVFDWCFG